MIKCFKPFIKRQDMQSVLNCLVNDNVSPSIRKDELVSEMCRYLNLSGGVPFRDCYIAVRTAFKMLELKPGDKVLISPLASSVYAAVAVEMGIDLLFCDVLEDTGCFNPELALMLRNKGPAAVILDYALGSVPDYSLVASWKIPVIEDISQVLGGGTDGDRVGSRGDLTILSMESRHIMTTGGGTLLMARQKVRAKYLAEWAETLPDDLLMTDLNASLGVIQLRSLEHYLDMRRNIEEIYIHSLMKTHHKLLHGGEESGRIPYTFPVIVDSGRKNLVQYARKHDIETTEPFSDAVILKYPDHMAACPVAESLMMRALAFPLYPGLKKDEINRVSRVLATLP